MPRPKLDMDEETFQHALYWAKYFVDKNGPHELNLAGIGESTMHPDLPKYLEMARSYMGPHQDLLFATNGVAMTEKLAAAIAPYRPRIWVSLHRPEKAGIAVEILKKYGLIAGVSADASIAATNWAGQVKWHVSVERRECMWVKMGKVIVFADGRVSRCSYDSTGVGVIATIKDDLSQFQTSPYDLCRTCDQDVGVPMEAASAA
jgi:MoaA/NifB/PqqE/SkfB family radical SAM enzyme